MCLVGVLSLSSVPNLRAQKNRRLCRLFLIRMVGRARFERATIALKVRLRLILKTAYNL